MDKLLSKHHLQAVGYSRHSQMVLVSLVFGLGLLVWLGGDRLVRKYIGVKLSASAIAQANFDCNVASGIPVNECQGLLALYNSTQGTGWRNSENWLATLEPCNWYGIYCKDGHVAEIRFYGNNVVGPLPTEIENLTHLEELIFGGLNELQSLPPQIGNLTRLRVFDLSGNTLTNLPTQFGQLSSLEELDLSSNSLNNLPAELGYLHNLKILSVYGNPLTNLPQEISNLSQLQELYLGRTSLISLPTTIGDLHSLRKLDFSSTNLTTLPPGVGQLSNLEQLNGGSSDLTQLPSEFGQLVNVKEIDFYGVPLTSLPVEFGNLIKLESLDLSNTRLSTLPATFGNLSGLKTLNLSNITEEDSDDEPSRLTLPAEFGNLANLETLNLSDNFIIDLSPSFGNLLKLKTLDLSFIRGDDSNGRIINLSSIFNLHVLEELDFSYSDLPEDFPTEVGNLKELRILDLSITPIITLPPTIGALTKLERLSLDSSEIFILPNGLGNLTNLQVLSFSDTPLQGALPLELTNLRQLSVLNFSETAVCLPSDPAFQAWINTVRSVDGERIICTNNTPGGSSLYTFLNVPAAHRPNRTYFTQINYTNISENEVVAPLFILSVTPNAPLKTACDNEWSTTAVQVFGVSSQGIAGKLAPKETGTIPVYYQGIDGDLTFDLQVLEAKEITVNWDQYFDSLRPSNLSQNEWSLIWPALKTRFGTTWKSYLELLGHQAERLRLRGQANHCVSELLALEIKQLLGRPVSAISGYLRQTETNTPLLGTRLIAYGQDNVTIRATDTNLVDGHFILNDLPDGQYEIKAEGYTFSPPLFVTISGGTDVNNQTLSATKLIDNSQPPPAPVVTSDYNPVLAVDQSGTLHLVWQRDEQMWHAVHVNGNWSDTQVISGAVGIDPTLASSSILGGNSSNLALVWQASSGNEPRLSYSLAQKDNNGHYSWQQPQSLTVDNNGDSNPVALTQSTGKVLVLWLQRNQNQADDSDLYFAEISTEQSLLNNTQWNQFRAYHQTALFNSLHNNNAISILSTNSPNTICLATWNMSKFSRPPSSIPVIGGKEFGISTDVEFCVNSLDVCNPTASANANLSVTLADVLELSGAGSGNLGFTADKKSCQYIFNQGSLSLSAGISGDIPVAPPFIKLLSFRINNKQIKLPLKIAVGLKTSGNVNGTMSWQGGSFPRTPDTGKIDMNLGLDAYGSISVDDVEASVTGGGLLHWYYVPPDSVAFDRVCLKLAATLNIYSKIKLTWSESYGDGCTLIVYAGAFHSTGLTITPEQIVLVQNSLIQNVPSQQVVEIGLEPFVGTGAVYEGQPVLGAAITTDLQHDGTPTVAQSPTGEILTVWTKDSASPSDWGSAVVASAYDQNQWSLPVQLQDATFFNQTPAVSFDSTGVPFALWSSAPANLSANATVTEVLSARDNSNLLFARRVNGIWSTPAPVTILEGQDTQVQVAAGPNGQLFAAWVNTNNNLDSLYTSFWNGTAWSTPESIVSVTTINSLAVAYHNNQPTMVWSQATIDGSDPINSKFKLFYTSRSTDGWLNSRPIDSDLQTNETFLEAASTVARNNSNYLLGQLISLPAPPDNCCDCPADNKDCDEPQPPPSGATYSGGGGGSSGRNSNDPNEKVGPTGIGERRIISTSDVIHYTIYFENEPEKATAPAQEVFITDQLDSNLDWSTLKFQGVAFGDQTLVVADQSNQRFHLRHFISDYRADINKRWWVDINGQLDLATGKVTWVLRHLDPETGDLPTDVLAGFLPPNDTSGRGEGYVSFTIKPKATTPLGIRITNKSSIVFDTNQPIETNETWNTIDRNVNTLYLPLISVNR